MDVFKEKKIVIFGGGSGMGYAIAKRAIAAGASVTIASRNTVKLQEANRQLGGKAAVLTVDQTNEEQVRSCLDMIGMIDHLVVTSASVRTGSVASLSISDAMASMLSKFWGPYMIVKSAALAETGSITLFSGVLSRKPSAGLAVVGSINAAVEGLGRSLAIELAPVRVNVVSPGLVATGIYDYMPEATKQAFFTATAKNLPVGRVGHPDDVALAVMMLMESGYITGTVLDIDGGGILAGPRR